MTLRSTFRRCTSSTTGRYIFVALLSSAFTATVMHNIQIGRISKAKTLSYMPSMFGGVGASAGSESGLEAAIPSVSVTPAVVENKAVEPVLSPSAPVAPPPPPSAPGPPPPPPPPPSPPADTGPPVRDGPLQTSWQCRRLGSWGDVCSYKDVCYDGRIFYFLTPGGCTGDLKRCGVFYEEADLKEGQIYPVYPVKEAHTLKFPFNGGALVGMHISPEELSSPGRTVRWTNRVMWRLPMHFPLDNIWFLSSRSMPVYKARKMNESGLFDPPMPSLGENDFLYVPQSSEHYRGGWQREFLRVVAGPTASVEYKDTFGADLNETSWVCMSNAVISGTFPGSVPDIQTGFEFRLDMYKHMGMTLPEKPPKKILFWFRTPPLYRSILNPEPLLALVEQYKWDYTYITDFPHDFTKQMELFSTHGVIVSPHGAGLINEMFFVPGSAVVEIFPYHFDHNLYPMLAANMGVGHYSVHTFNGSDTWSRDKPYHENKCEDVPALAINFLNPKCRDGSTYYRIWVSVRDFEAALVNAMEHSGHRTRFRGLAPVRDNHTETGWSAPWA